MTGAEDAVVSIVDDDEAVRDSLRILLMSAGLTVETYASARDFLVRFDPKRRGCILLDVLMPEMTGLDLLKHLAATGLRLPVIVITGHGDVPMAVQAMKAGAFDFLEKPFTEEAILDSVRRSLAENTHPSIGGASAADLAQRLARLTRRERQVFEHLVAGKPNKVIGHALGISMRTAEVHRAQVMRKMEAHNLSELVRMGLALGMNPTL